MIIIKILRKIRPRKILAEHWPRLHGGEAWMARSYKDPCREVRLPDRRARTDAHPEALWRTSKRVHGNTSEPIEHVRKC